MTSREHHPLLGQDAAWRRFRATLARQAMPTAWLLHGPSGIGKASMACSMAHALLYPPAAERPFLIRPPDSHGDFFRIDPDDDRDSERAERKSGQITIDDVRRMRDFLGLRPERDGWRVVVIDRADRLNRESANGLLKSLEEPPEQSVFFIVSDHPGRLPLTLLSRCRPLVMNPLGERDFRAVLERLGCETGDRNWHRVSSGSPGMALRLIEEDFSRIESRIESLWKARERTPAADMAALAGMIGSGKSGKDRWPLFHAVLRRRLRAAILEEKDDSRRRRLWSLWDCLQRLEHDLEAFHLDPAHGVFAMGALIHRCARTEGAGGVES